MRERSRGRREERREARTVRVQHCFPLLSFPSSEREESGGGGDAPDIKSLYLSPSPPTEEQWWSAVPAVSDEKDLAQVHCKSMVMGVVNTM